MFTLAAIAEHIQAEIKGDPSCEITGIATLQDAQPGEISFLDNPKYRRYLPATAATAVILKSDDAAQCPANALIVSQPYVAYAKTAQLFVPKAETCVGVHATAIIGEGCQIDPSASIGAYVVIGNRCKIGANTRINAHCTLGDDTCLGDNTVCHPRVTLYHQTQVGHDCEIHSGAVIGADGFGLANENGQWLHVPQMGAVVIGNRVSIGANTTIDRGTIGNTVIGDGVKLDNQIQIAHNVEIGENTAIAACVGISGSSKIGKQCILAGGVGVAGHIQLADNVIVTAMAGVSNSINQPGTYSGGFPALPNREWRRNTVTLRRIDKLVQRINYLETKLKENKPTSL